jgi:Sec-independent protein translocase protein TatA
METGGTMETKIIAIIILLVVLFFAGATTFIYWGSRIQEWRKIFKKAMAEVEAEQANTMQQEKPKEPINLAWVKRHLTVPAIFLATFTVEYVVASSLMGSERVEFLFILVFAMLAMVVLETLGIDKKAPRVRFGIRLGVAILFELFFACEVYMFVSGYYFGDGFRLKRIAGAIAGIFLFFAEAYRAQHDWYAVLDEKKQEGEV